MAGPWHVRARRPKGNARVNFAHPLARDIAFFYFDAQGTDSTGPTFYDAVTGKIGSSASGQTRTSQGTLAFSASRSTTTTAFTNYKAVQTTTQTILARCKLTTKPADRTVPVFYGNNGSRGVLVAFNSSGNAGGGNWTTNGVLSAYDAIDHTGEWVVLAGRGETSGAAYGYVNGNYIGTTISGSAAAQSIDRVTMGRDPSGYYNAFTGEVDWAMGFNRVLSDPEIKQLSNNPWQILAPAYDLGWFSLDAGGGGGVSVALTGISATGSVGSVVARTSHALTGISGTGSVGSVSSKISHALTGISGTGSLGTLTPTSGNTVALTGIQGTGSVGSVTARTSHALTGISGTGSVGTITPSTNKNVALTGISGTGSVGTLGKSVSHALTGNQATGALGTLTPSTAGPVTIALTGISATGYLGTLTPSGGLVDTHDGGEKRRKAHEKQKKKEIKEDRERQEKRLRQMVEAFEQVIEGKVSRETNIEQVIATAAEYAVETAEIVAKSDFDFQKWVDNLANVERILDDYLERDDEDVLVLL